MKWIAILFLALFAVVANAAEVKLEWQDNSSGLNQEDEFVIERHLARQVPGQVVTEPDPSDTWGEVARVPADTTEHTNTTTQHRCYRVAAVNAAGMSDYTDMKCTQTQIPTAPTNMEISDMSFSVRLQWGEQEVVLTGE